MPYEILFFDAFGCKIPDDGLSEAPKLNWYREALKRAMHEESSPARAASFLRDMKAHSGTRELVDGFMGIVLLGLKGDELVKFMCDFTVDERIKRVEAKKIA